MKTADTKSPNERPKRLWWIPTLGFGIAILLLGATGWISIHMTSQFREYGNHFLKQQTEEQLKALAQEESQLIELAIRSLSRGRFPTDLLSEEFSILFSYDLAAVINETGSLDEGYLFTTEGSRTIEPGSPWHAELSNTDQRLEYVPVTFRFVMSESDIYLIYSIRDPRNFNDRTLVFGRKMPHQFDLNPSNSPGFMRVVQIDVDSEDLEFLDTWDLSDSPIMEEFIGFDRRRGGMSPFDNRRRFPRGGPPGRGGRDGGQRWEHPAPLTAQLIRQGLQLSKNNVQSEDGTSRSLVYSVLQDRGNSVPVRVEFLISREFPETLESTIQAIRRNSFGVSLLVCLFTIIVVSEMRRRKLAETSLRDRNDKLNEANQRKDRLLAIISHDLRAPLSGVGKLSGLLMKQPESFTADEIRKFAGEIQGTSKHLTELLDNLLNWARLQTGQLPYFPGSIDLERVTHQLCTLFKSTAKDQGVELKSRVHQEAKLINDVEMLRTVLRNLLSNAIRHTPSGGSVAIYCESQQESMRIEVRDTGTGMTLEEKSQLFQLPDKPRDPTEVGKKGAGFGLVLSQMLAKRMGGELSVVSSNKEGTTFRLEIPLQWLPESKTNELPQSAS